MNKQKKILICEFITGGGLSDQEISPGLVKEGTLMRDALLRDLHESSSFEVITMHDKRLSIPMHASKSYSVSQNGFEDVFINTLAEVDYVWIIAPELNGVLLHMTKQCKQQELRGGPRLIGCGIEAVTIAADKVLSYEAMSRAIINTLPILSGAELCNKPHFLAYTNTWQVRQYVAKPIQGMGCEGIRIFDDTQTLYTWLHEENRHMYYFVQPFQEGEHASFSMLCHHGCAWLLSMNKQEIQLERDCFRLDGIVLNHNVEDWAQFTALAQKIALMLPDASGYVGVDVILQNGNIIVVDINPRLTSSYVGMREAIGLNVAQLIFDCVTMANFQMPMLQKNRVEIRW